MQTSVLCVQGPTASGKSALADGLAVLLDGEIVSADSMQVYRFMDIGTAKTPADERGVAYHCIDLVDPGEPFSAALFQDHARRAIDGIDASGKLPVLVGGTGLYVSAVIDDMRFAPGEQEGNEVRRRYEELLARIGAEGLHDMLRERDPQSAEAIHPHNVRRVIRALEMHEAGESYAERKERFRCIAPYYKTVKIGLAVDPDVLRARIDMRVEQMLASGLVDEVRELLERGFRSGLTASQAIGYKELVRFLDGVCPFEEAVEDIKKATRRYAKRQRTWLRSQKDVHWIDVTDGVDGDVIERAAELVCAIDGRRAHARLR